MVLTGERTFEESCFQRVQCLTRPTDHDDIAPTLGLSVPIVECLLPCHVLACALPPHIHLGYRGRSPGLHGVRVS